VSHWTEALANVVLVEFVLLAVLTLVEWVRHRVRGSGWVALAFTIVAAVSVTLKVDPGLTSEHYAAKSLLALLIVVPYCIFRFTSAFRRPSLAVRTLALLVTAGLVAFTFVLRDLPVHGAPVPPHFLAYRVCFLAGLSFVLGYLIIRLLAAGRGEPSIAAWRIHLLALAVAGLEALVVMTALRLHGTVADLATLAVAAVTGVLLLVALVFPSIMRVFLSREEDVAFRQAVGRLVSAGDSKDVAEYLLPHVCTLVGATEAALLASDGTVVARYPLWLEGDRLDPWGTEPRSGATSDRIVVRTTSGASHALAVKISPFMGYFGTEELRKLDQLADMVGLAIERCEMAEQMAFQASHDGLTGLANRALFMERLEEALSHVGRRRSSLAVLFIDLDRFKLVNDRADHTAGDELLNEVANRLMAMTRGVDVVARFGGDEFVAFAEVEHEDDARDMAERIRKGLGQPVSIGGLRFVVTASIGVVVTSDAATTAAALLRDADNAMYEAKRSGRDQVVIYSRSARDSANRRWALTGVSPSRLSVG